MLIPKRVFISVVIKPTRPSVEMNANASGTPAKFDATPENVTRKFLTPIGRPPTVTA